MKTRYTTLNWAIGLTISALACSTPGLASAESEDTIEEIVVIGSHIKGVDLNGAVKAVQLNRDDIEASGATSIIDLLSTLPVVGGGTGTFSTTNSGPQSSATPVGASAVSLRGLGTASTLTLINGRRSTVSSFAKGSESFIDVNSIPLSAIERVEILPSGASATYGADAVAGVINYKLRDDFEGTEFTLRHGNSEANSDEGNFNANFLWGHNFEDSNLTVVVDYYERNAFAFNDRSRLIEADPFGSSRSPFVDAFFVGDYDNQGIDENCPLVAQTSFGPECRDLPNTYLNVDDDFEAISSLVSFKKELGDITWFNELMYSKTESAGRTTPSTWRLNVATDHPSLQTDTDLMTSILEANRANYDADNGAGATDALIAGLANPGGADDAIFALDTFGDGFMRINGRFPDAREFEVESETLRFVSGLEGQYDKWDWNTAITYARNENEQIASQGYYIREQVQHGLLGNLCDNGVILEGPGGRIVDIGDGDTIEIDNQPPLSIGGQFLDTFVTCENTGNGSTVWYDPFNGQLAAGNDAFKTPAKRSGEAELFNWDATISTTEFMSLPAGNVAAAFGVEYRREEIEDVPAGISVANANTNDPVWAFAGTSADYDRTSFSAFFEFVAPLTDNLEATLAGRLDDYDDFGNDFNPMIRLRYQPTEKIIFRGNWSTSFRAPSLAQAGQGVRLTSHTFSCENLPADITNPVAGATAANLCDGIGTDVDDVDQVTEGLNTEELGSDNLVAEEAETYGIGFVFTPNDDITLSVDWWRIEYEDLVSSFTTNVEQSFIESQLRAGNVVLGSNLSDLASGTDGVLIDENTGEILDTHFQLFNTGFQNVEGVDIAYTQYFELSDIGTLRLTFDASYLVEYEEKVCDTCLVDQLSGEFTYPRWLASVGLRFTRDKLSASIFGHYTHGYEEDGLDDRVGGPTNDELAQIGLDVADLSDVSSWTLWDLNVAYDFNDRSYVSFNVDNLFDRNPPRTVSNYEGVDFFNHNILGRAYSVRYTHTF